MILNDLVSRAVLKPRHPGHRYDGASRSSGGHRRRVSCWPLSDDCSLWAGANPAIHVASNPLPRYTVCRSSVYPSFSAEAGPVGAKLGGTGAPRCFHTWQQGAIIEVYSPAGYRAVAAALLGFSSTSPAALLFVSEF